MVVADDKLDADEPAGFERQEKVAPARSALAIGELDCQDLAPAVFVDRHRDQHRLADDDPGLAHLLVACIEDQIGIVLAQPPLGKRPQTLVERFVDRADRGCGKTVAAQRLGHRLDLARRNALHVHLGQGADQRFLRTLVAFEQLSRKSPQPILRHAQFQGPYPGDQRAAVIAAAVGNTRLAPLPLLGADRLRHLRLERGLHQRLHRCTHEILVPRQQSFQVDYFRLTLALGHDVHPSRVGDVRHHQHAMTAQAARLIAEPSAHYRNFLQLGRAANFA